MYLRRNGQNVVPAPAQTPSAPVRSAPVRKDPDEDIRYELERMRRVMTRLTRYVMAEAGSGAASVDARKVLRLMNYDPDVFMEKEMP